MNKRILDNKHLANFLIIMLIGVTTCFYYFGNKKGFRILMVPVGFLILYSVYIYILQDEIEENPLIVDHKRNNYCL